MNKNAKSKVKQPSAQDQTFFEKCQNLVGMANRAREEAEQYADSIEDAELREKAKDLLLAL